MDMYNCGACVYGHPWLDGQICFRSRHLLIDVWNHHESTKVDTHMVGMAFCVFL